MEIRCQVIVFYENVFDFGFPYKHCYFKACLPTRRSGVENCDKAYHLARGDYSRGALTFKMAAQRFVGVSNEEVNTMKENAIPKGTKDAAKSEVILFEDKI